MNSENQSFTKKLWPLATTQFLGVFNDHAFKMVSILAVTRKSTEYSDDALFLSFLTVIYVMPFLLFPIFAGYFADRFQKKNVMVLAKIAELLVMLMGTVVLFNFENWGMWPLIGIMFLMATQSAFFSPSFNGLLPEVFGEKNISHANGTIGLFTFIAVISGVAGGVMLTGLAKDNLVICGILFSVFSFIGLLAVKQALSGKPANSNVKWTWDFLTKYRDGIQLLLKKKSILFAILGESYFLAIGTAIQALLILYAKFSLGMKNEIDIGLIQLAPAFGMGFGSYLAGRISGKKVELGLVPYGAAGLALFLLTTVYAAKIPLSFAGNHIIYPGVLFSLLLLGICGGLFVIPLRSYYQQKTEEATRGSLIANANVICFGFILISGLAMLYLTAGTDSGNTSGFLPGLTAYCLSLDPNSIFLWIAALTLGVTIFTFSLLPEFAIRFAAVTLSHTLYRLRIYGDENIPAKGPALIISNHVSFIDGVLISASTSRMIRFMIHSDFYNHPLLKWFCKWMGFIEVADPGTTKGLKDAIKKARRALHEGDLLCIFPEGQITKNGIMNEFKKGVNFMLPPDEDIPIIPVRLGRIWGSIFSYYFGNVKLRRPTEFPYPATVTVGKPISKDTPPHKLRSIVAELAMETEMPPREREKTLHFQFTKRAKRHPFQKRFFDASSDSDKLNTGVSNFSMLLRAILLSCEIRKKTEAEHVGILLPNTTVTAIAILATMLADKIPAVLNFSVSSEVLDKAVAKADIDCILTSKLFVRKAKLEKRDDMVFLEDIAKNITGGKKFSYLLKALLLPSGSLMKHVAPETYHDVSKNAVLLFSSGSTGDPKGVDLSHHNVNSNVNSLLKIAAWDAKKDALAGNLPLFHSFGMNTSFWIPMMTGTKVVYLPNPLDATATLKAIQEYKLTILLAIPSLLQAYMRKGSPRQFSSLRLVIVGAEKLRLDISEKFKEMTGLIPTEGYGCTELSPIVSVNIPKDIQNLGKEIGKQNSIGLPMPGICVKIVNPDSGEEVEIGETGLMMVKGPNVMKQYLKDTEKTAEVFKDGWYNTGDIAKIDQESYITITGRISRFSKIAGEMVPHEMVETGINDIIKPEVRSITVIGAPDDKKGEKLIVFYTDISKPPREIVDILRKEQTMPNLWIPKVDNFIKIDEIPRLGSGKVNLKILQEKGGT